MNKPISGGEGEEKGGEGGGGRRGGREGRGEGGEKKKMFFSSSQIMSKISFHIKNHIVKAANIGFYSKL